MTNFTAILRDLSPEKFDEMYAASPRPAKQIYLKRLGLKNTNAKASLASALRAAPKSSQIFQAILDQEDHDVAEEMIRTWLLMHRPLLIAALDHMGIPHENGITESNDVDKIATMNAQEIKALMDALCAVGPKEDAAIYIRFMGGSLG